MIRIVTDSTCSPLESYNKKNNIIINPLRILFEDEEFTESEELYETIYKKMIDTGEIPKTSQPSVDSFVQIYEKIIRDGDEGIILTLSQNLSGTYSCACLARESCSDPSKIYVLDTQGISQTAVGYIYETVEMIKEGKNVEEIISYIKKLRKNSAITFIPESFDNLKKNGRIGNIKAVVASFLNIKPIITFKEGMLKDKKSIGIKKAISDLIKEVPQNIKRLFIIKASFPEYFESFKEHVLGFFKNVPVELGIVSPVVGAHVGPSIGLAWIAE